MTPEPGVQGVVKKVAADAGIDDIEALRASIDIGATVITHKPSPYCEFQDNHSIRDCKLVDYLFSADPYNYPRSNSAIRGTFKQHGKELDAKLLHATGMTAGQICCPNKHSMSKLGDVGVEAGILLRINIQPDDVLVCVKAECPYFGVLYRACWPAVHLEALTDA